MVRKEVPDLYAKNVYDILDWIISVTFWVTVSFELQGGILNDSYSIVVYRLGSPVSACKSHRDDGDGLWRRVRTLNKPRPLHQKRKEIRSHTWWSHNPDICKIIQDVCVYRTQMYLSRLSNAQSQWGKIDFYSIHLENQLEISWIEIRGWSENGMGVGRWRWRWRELEQYASINVQIPSAATAAVPAPIPSLLDPPISCPSSSLHSLGIYI